MMAGVLQSATSPSMASFAGESNRSLTDVHYKVFSPNSSRHCANKGRVYCTSSNFDFHQNASSVNYQHNPSAPPSLPDAAPLQPPYYQTPPPAYQGWSRPFQSDPSQNQTNPQYQNNASRYQPLQSQSALYENPYRPVFKEPHQPMGYQQGPSSSQYTSQPPQHQTQQQYQNQPPSYQRVQTQTPLQFQSPLQSESQYQNRFSNLDALKTGNAAEPMQSLQAQSSETSSLFKSTPTPAMTSTPSSIPQSSLLSSPTSQTSSSSSSSSSSFLSSSYSSDLYGRSSMSNVRRRPYDPEAKMRMKQYRREAMIRQRQQEQENLEKNYVLDVDALYKKGDPGTVQGVVKDIITVGYYMSLPDGREGFLPCMQFNDCPGGIPLLTRLFKVGDEIPVRQEKMYDGGLDKLHVKP